jgi:hypothetical protein
MMGDVHLIMYMQFLCSFLPHALMGGNIKELIAHKPAHLAQDLAFCGVMR